MNPRSRPLRTRGSRLPTSQLNQRRGHEELGYDLKHGVTEAAYGKDVTVIRGLYSRASLQINAGACNWPSTARFAS